MATASSPALYPREIFDVQTAAISPTNPSRSAASNSATSTAATSAFGLSFDSLLKIILTQLTYQDPLKPMDNFQFVSQLAQFSQIQIGQTTNDKLTALATAQSNVEAAGLLGKQVDIGAGAAVITGTVTAIAFSSGNSSITIQTADKQTISNINITSITQIRQGS
jgi:flagellar basal-body rod modification protein FlgD